MTLVALIVLLILLGIVLYLVPIEERIRNIIVVLAILGVVVWILRASNLVSGVPFLR